MIPDGWDEIESDDPDFDDEIDDGEPDFGPSEDMDGDHQSALSSIGWGDDEDYGDFAWDGDL